MVGRLKGLRRDEGAAKALQKNGFIELSQKGRRSGHLLQRVVGFIFLRWYQEEWERSEDGDVDL